MLSAWEHSLNENDDPHPEPARRKCLECRGTGEVLGEECESCRGYGYIIDDEVE